MKEEHPHIMWLREMWTEWDPLGVMHIEDCPRDEYDFYLEPTLTLLKSGATEEKLEKFLCKISEDWMRTDREYSRPDKFAKKLLKIWEDDLGTRDM